MSLSLATPALLSLKVRRTANEIIDMDATGQTGLTTQPIAQPSIVSKVAIEPADDNADEIRTVEDLLEQQCFALVACHNTIHDAREAQAEILRRFHTRANTIEAKLANLSQKLFSKIRGMNNRIDMISRTLAPKPIFRQLQPPNEYERVTGIAIGESMIALTMASGHLVVLNQETLGTEYVSQPLPSEALFNPAFVARKNMQLSLLCLSSGGKLMFSCPLKSDPSVCADQKIECFAVAERAVLNDGFDVVAGMAGRVGFYGLDSVRPKELKLLGETTNIKGTASQVVVDDQEEVVYVLTSKRVLYAISGTSFEVISSVQFRTPLMQLGLTALFIVVSCAPNTVVLLERKGENHQEQMRFEITSGLRRLCCSEKEILVITKKQEVERRMLCNPLVADTICARQAADYDPLEYMGAIHMCANKIYLSHGNRISVWS